ncbi:MAG: cyclase family protein [Calditrichaeota bacterium]|nr:cyclase family protein [Calditrichota bacterium]
MMNLMVEIAGRSYRVRHDRPAVISIPLQFDGPQPTHFGAAPAGSRALESGGFTGDTRRGGSCNVDEIRLIPHCNGTHTECVGHISDQHIAIREVLQEALIPATLLTVTPRPAAEVRDQYLPTPEAGDMLLIRSELESALAGVEADFLAALVVRTLPNHPTKVSRDYLSASPPYFSLDAMRFLLELGVQHLLVDIPSLDRMFDEGRLSAHRIFWEVAEGTHQINPATASRRTITEMIYVPDALPDGTYLLNIQIPDFALDAAPSRVWLYGLKKP